MWVIVSCINKELTRQYDVGWMDGDSFVPIGEPFAHLGDAMNAVHYLNGGTDRTDIQKLLTILTRIQHELTDIRGQLRYVR
jgi:hypothetical protein